MSKTRIHELAKELNISTKDLIDAASKQGMGTKTALSALEDNDVSKLKNLYKSKEQKVEEKKTHNKIIYDRTKEIKEEEERTKNRNYSSGDRNRTGNQGDYKKEGYNKDRNSNYNRDNNRGGYQNRSNSDRPQGDRPYNNRQQGDRPQGDRPQGDRPQGDRPYNNRYQGDRPQGDRPYNNRSQGDRPQGDRPQGDRPQGDRPYNNRSQGDRPQGDRPYNNRYQGDRPQGDRPYNNRSQGDRPQGDRPYNNRYQGDRPQGDRPYGNRPQGDRPQGDRPYGNRPQGDRPYGNRPQGDRPYGNRPQGDRPYGKPGFDKGAGFDKDSKPFSKDRGPKKKKDAEGDFPAIEIAEKTPSKKKMAKKDKPASTFEKDRLENRSKKATKLRKEQLTFTDESDVQKKFDFGKKVKQKSGRYKDKSERERNERIEEMLTKEIVYVPNEMTVKEFAETIHKQPNDIIIKLMGMGIMATINQPLDYDTAALIAIDYNIALEIEEVEEENHVEAYDLEFEDEAKDLVKRAPVVTVMGHVDHGKTSLLDAIRNTGVASGEAGGITQHIGASEIMHNNEKIVFLDTPGHEAFTSLRARGAKITDIAILVVAADDGVMPQTIEAIDHSKAAGVPIIVAINKMDKPEANPDRVKQELADRGVVIEEWGGDVIAVPVSAKTGEGLETLLETVILVSEMLELKANPNRAGIGTVIEAKVVKGRGTVATIILEKGTMSVGDPIVAGTTFGRVKAMYNHRGKKVKTVGPSSSIEIDGLTEIPQAGEKIYVTPDEKVARAIAEKQAIDYREKTLNKNMNVTLEDLFSKIQEGVIKDLNIIIKADVHGSVEAIKQSLLKLTTEEVRVNIVHANVGAISESDVILASASKAIIIGFNVRPSANVSSIAEQEGVNIRTYSIIYEAINDVQTALNGMLDPEYKEVVLGRIQVRATFKIPSGVIAGGYVLNGKVPRAASVRVIREGIVIHEGKISSLKRFKDDVKEVATGYECGIGIEKFNDLKENDEIEAFTMEEIKRNS